MQHAAHDYSFLLKLLRMIMKCVGSHGLLWAHLWPLSQQRSGPLEVCLYCLLTPRPWSQIERIVPEPKRGPFSRTVPSTELGTLMGTIPKVEVEVTLRLTVSQYVLVRAHSGTCDQILLPVWKLRSCIYWSPSLTTGRVCNLQCTHSAVRVAQNP
jgi:hypothetical protein